MPLIWSEAIHNYPPSSLFLNVAVNGLARLKTCFDKDILRGKSVDDHSLFMLFKG